MGRFSPDPGPTPDAVLLDAMSRGDYSAFTELYARYRDRALALASRLLEHAQQPTSEASTGTFLAALFTRLIEERPRIAMHEDLSEHLSALAERLVADDRIETMPPAPGPSQPQSCASPGSASRTSASPAARTAPRDRTADAHRPVGAIDLQSPVDAFAAEVVWRYMESVRTARKVRRWGAIALLVGAAALAVWLLRLAGYSSFF